MDDYKKIPFDDPDLCVPDLDDFDQMKEFFLECAAEYFRYLSSDDMEKMLAALGKRVDVLATPTDDVFISVSPDAVLRQYPDITIDEAIQIRDNACENIWESGGQSDLDEIVWDQIGAEYKSIKSDSHRGLSDVKDAKAKQAVHVNGYTLNAARTIREYESSIQRPKAERTINDSILSALLRGDELPEMDVKAIRQYGIQCSEYLDFGYDVDASLSGMLSPHAVLEPRPNTPYVFRRAGFDNLPFIYTQRHLRNAIAPKEADNHQHGLTIEQIKALPEKLEEPVVVFDQPNYTVNGRSFEGKGVAAVLDMYDPDGVPVIAYFFPNGYGTKTNDNGCSNVIASLYGRDNFTSYLARAANEEKILYIDSEKYEQMEKELPRYGGTRFPPALAALSMDIIIPSSYICKMKAEINPKLSDREREHNSLNRTMHIKVADSRRNRLAQDRDKPRNITLRYDDDNRDSQ